MSKSYLISLFKSRPDLFKRIGDQYAFTLVDSRIRLLENKIEIKYFDLEVFKVHDISYLQPSYIQDELAKEIYRVVNIKLSSFRTTVIYPHIHEIKIYYDTVGFKQAIREYNKISSRILEIYKIIYKNISLYPMHRRRYDNTAYLEIKMNYEYVEWKEMFPNVGI